MALTSANAKPCGFSFFGFLAYCTNQGASHLVHPFLAISGTAAYLAHALCPTSPLPHSLTTPSLLPSLPLSLILSIDLFVYAIHSVKWCLRSLPKISFSFPSTPLEEPLGRADLCLIYIAIFAVLSLESD